MLPWLYTHCTQVACVGEHNLECVHRFFCGRYILLANSMDRIFLSLLDTATSTSSAGDEGLWRVHSLVHIRELLPLLLLLHTVVESPS